MESDKEEAVRVASDVLSHLLEEVYSLVEKCSVVTSQAPTASAKDVHPNGLLHTVLEYENGILLTGFSHRRGRFQLYQFSVAKQHKSGYCGHHALHNALLARQLCTAGSRQEVHDLVHVMRSSPAYWWRYWYSLKQLLERVDADTWWPWTEEHIVTGDMERSFLHYLLDRHHTSRDSPIHVMQYAYGFVQDPAQHILQLHRALVSFQTAAPPTNMVFVLGVTNHWVTALVTKETANGTNTPNISVVYLDSHNIPVVTFTEDDILQHITKKEEERIKKKGKGWTQWERDITKQAFVDQREVVHMLARCASGDSDLCSERISFEVNKMIQSFDSMVTDMWKEMGGGEDVLLLLLMSWVESYTIKSLRDGLRLLEMFGVSCVARNTRKQLVNWVGFLESNKFVNTNLSPLYTVSNSIKKLF